MRSREKIAYLLLFVTDPKTLLHCVKYF
ncbi:hypothetical protein FGIG_04823 [Fasciola gigantica]|uniref:Uncharacterized protein n=1 Tax=Fasciola gigantica TaxID=46835 RepID=A0A504YGM3_FASGI|nr:hypothetical protein FGIG_04823 [Fasciola gigantica]